MKGSERGKVGAPKEMRSSRFAGMGASQPQAKSNAAPDRPVDARLAPPPKLKAGASMRLAGFAAKKRA